MSLTMHWPKTDTRTLYTRYRAFASRTICYLSCSLLVIYSLHTIYCVLTALCHIRSLAHAVLQTPRNMHTAPLASVRCADTLDQARHLYVEGIAMAHSPSKRARLQLRSRVRDDAPLNRRSVEVRAHEKKAGAGLLKRGTPQAILAVTQKES